MVSPIRIAVILPLKRISHLAGTLVDGLVDLQSKGAPVGFALNEHEDDWKHFSFKGYMQPAQRFVEYARTADLVILCDNKDGTDLSLAEKIGRWERTVFVDGSEPGKNRRFDAEIQYKVLSGEIDGFGGYYHDMYKKAALYCKREKPYLPGMLPLPFGIERRFQSFRRPASERDFDIFCIYGQDEFPPLRQYANKLVKDFCDRHGLTCAVDRLPTEEYYALIGRCKVAVSIGGGGFDTSRFWQFLGAGCTVLTERIDIYPPESDALRFNRIREFNNLYDLQYRLEQVREELVAGWPPADDDEEYARILVRHSSAARVMEIIEMVKAKGII